MKVSLNWLREMLSLEKTVEEISDLLTFAGVEVEGIERKGVDIARVVVAQIQSSEPHPNADRLSVCKVDDGSGSPRQIVCGAKNYLVGDKVPLALPGAVLPGDFKIKVGKLRGVESEGMLCSAKELGISEESAGLLILSPAAEVGVEIGSLFPADTLFDLEITPNRADLLSHQGIARELGAITGEPLLSSEEQPLESATYFTYDEKHDCIGKRRSSDPQATLEDLQRCALDVRRRSAAADAAERIRAESESLLEWAKTNGWLIDAESFKSAVAGFEEFEGGNEHFVWRVKDGSRVVKATKPPNFGARGELASYIANIILANRTFGDDFRLEGVVSDRSGLAVVTSQPFIRGSSATENEIVQWMGIRGFLPVGNDCFRHEDGTVLADARPANILKAEDELFPIDVHILGRSGVVSSQEVSGGQAASFPVRIESGACPFYSGRIVRGVKVGPSPEWLVLRLQSIGLRSINNVVDVTNFVMFELGQPLHAFDLAKIDRGIVVRNAAVGEKFLALDGREYLLAAEDLVIADESRALAIAGVMGGKESGVSAETTEILLESALFVSQNIRRTSRRLGLSSDSSYRYERGVDPGQLVAAAERACELLAATAGGTAEDFPSTAGELPQLAWPVPLRNERCREILGAPVSDMEIDGILSGLGLRKGEAGEWIVPSFRADLTREADLIEEVARVFGIQNVPASAASLAVPPSPVDRFYDFQMSLKRSLAARGFSEARTLSLRPLHEATLRSPEALRVRNPLTEDQTFFRESLVPGLLQVAETNFRMGATAIRLLEVGRTFQKRETGSAENTTLGLLMTGLAGAPDWRNASQALDFFALKAELAGLLNCDLQFSKSAQDGTAFATAISLAGSAVGWAGQLSPAIVRESGLKAPVFVAELNLSALFEALPVARRFSALPKYPAIVRDIALLAPETVSHAEIAEALLGAHDPLLREISLFDVFSDPTGEKIPLDKKSLAYSLTYRADDRTLLQDEVNAAHARLKARLVEQCGVTLRE